MTSSIEEGEATMLSPDAAFSALGNETRVQILQTLGEADGPLSFTELRSRIGIRHGEQFNYHLGKLVGHFVSKTDEGYVLRRAGERVVEAVFSGAVTDAPVVERTQIDQSCYLCGAPVEVNFTQERVGVYCTECPGNYGRAPNRGTAVYPEDECRLGYLTLPPAGVQDRTPTELLSTATTWMSLEFFARACGVCPRCSAPLDESVRICETHDATDSLCDQCNNNYAVQHHVSCTNCIYGNKVVLLLAFFANREFLAFLTMHGVNPVSPSSEFSLFEVTGDYEEELLSVEPLKVRLTATIDDDAFTLTINDELDVVEASW